MGDQAVRGPLRQAARAPARPAARGRGFQGRGAGLLPRLQRLEDGPVREDGLHGPFPPGSPASGGQTTNAIPAGGFLKFKGVAGRQEVDYAALLDDSRSIIIGSYLSRWPDDYGHFEIDRY